MIQKDQIKKMCGTNSVFARGEQLLKRGSIGDMQGKAKVVDGRETIHIHAKVKGSGINLYQVTADICEEESLIMGVTCTCPAFYSYDGICKHCAAVLLQYLKGQGRRQFAVETSVSRGIVPGRSSSYSVTKLIGQYKEKGRLTFQQSEINGTIELVPHLQISYGHLHAEFKIGSKKKYVLKNTQIFADALKRRELVAYGKELEFYHTLEAFTQGSRSLAQFLLQEAASRARTGTITIIAKGVMWN